MLQLRLSINSYSTSHRVKSVYVKYADSSYGENSTIKKLDTNLVTDWISLCMESWKPVKIFATSDGKVRGKVLHKVTTFYVKQDSF